MAEGPLVQQRRQIKLTCNSPETDTISRKTRHDAMRYVLINGSGDQKELMFRKRGGQLAECYTPSDVDDALKTIHGAHGHYAADITGNWLLAESIGPPASRTLETTADRA